MMSHTLASKAFLRRHNGHINLHAFRSQSMSKRAFDFGRYDMFTNQKIRCMLPKNAFNSVQFILNFRLTSVGTFCFHAHRFFESSLIVEGIVSHRVEFFQQLHCFSITLQRNLCTSSQRHALAYTQKDHTMLKNVFRFDQVLCRICRQCFLSIFREPLTQQAIARDLSSLVANPLRNLMIKIQTGFGLFKVLAQKIPSRRTLQTINLYKTPSIDIEAQSRS